MLKLILLALFLAGFAQAQNTYRFEIFGSATYLDANKNSQFNTDNRILEIPQMTYTAEVRPDFQINFTNSHSVVLRSRHFLQGKQYVFTNPDEESEVLSSSDSDLSDLFFTSNWTRSFATTIGLQNYQWGPAEIFSPTNPFFHFNNNQRSFFFKEKGRVIARANLDPAANWSIVGLVEPVNNQTPYWTADQKFTPRSALKIEYQFKNPVNSIAFIVGQGDLEKQFFGEYFNFSPIEGVSLYADVKHQFGKSNYVPVDVGLGTYDMEVPIDDDIYTLGIVGFRWEGRVDFRQEFIFNSAGYTKEEWQNAKASALTLAPNVLQNAKRFSSPGLEFRTQAYSYTSLRIPNIGPSEATSLSARWLASMTEESSALQLNCEHDWNDHVVISAELIQFLGKEDTEFKLTLNTQASLGFRWNW